MFSSSFKFLPFLLELASTKVYIIVGLDRVLTGV